MPPSCTRYTLVGFSPELDWRPLTFLKPIPPNRVCSACGLMRKRTALLPCMHVLCECCHEQCAQDGSHACPLDGSRYEEEDVHTMDSGELLRREVKCWNERSGCQYTTTASGIAQHFLRECGHHSACCPKCSATVLCRDVRNHLMSASCNPFTVVASKTELNPGHLDETAYLTSFRGAFERQAEEIVTYLRPMAVDVSTHGDRLNEINHGINSLKEAMKQELADATRKNHDSLTKSVCEMAASNGQLKECFVTNSDRVNNLSRSITSLENVLINTLSETRDVLSQIAPAVEQIRAEVIENSQKTLNCVGSVPRHNGLQTSQCVFFVKGVRSLQGSLTTLKRWADYESQQVYLGGYCMTPGVWLIDSGECVTLHGRYTLHKGHMDDAVRWPFENKIRMSVIHPKGGEECSVECKSLRGGEANQKPSASNNRSAFFPDQSFYLKDLLRDGYVENDQLVIKWELLP